MPASRSVASSRVTWPARTNTGIRRDRAPAASALTTLPCSDWSSNRPSPVMTSWAAATSSASRVCSAMIAAPDSRRPPSASSPAPMPPAAPAPGFVADRPACRRVQFHRPVAQPLFQDAHGVGVGTLLRAEHGRRAHRSEQSGARRRWRRSARHPPAARGPRGQPAQFARSCRGRRRCSAAAEPDHDPPGARAAPRRRSAVPLPCCARPARSARSADRPAAPARRPARTRCRRSGARPGRAPTPPTPPRSAGRSPEGCAPHRACRPARRRSRARRRTAGPASAHRRGGRGASRPRSPRRPRPP